MSGSGKVAGSWEAVTRSTIRRELGGRVRVRGPSWMVCALLVVR